MIQPYTFSDGIEECVQCGLQVMDISDPTAPAEIDFYSLPYPKGVTVTNGYAYVSSPAGLYILQPTRPERTRFRWSFECFSLKPSSNIH